MPQFFYYVAITLDHIQTFVVVQLPSRVWLFVTPWTAASQASLSLTISQSLPKFMSIALVMPSSHLILWCPLFLPSIFPSIMDFFKELSVRIRWQKYWSFSFSFSPSSEELLSVVYLLKNILRYLFFSIELQLK